MNYCELYIGKHLNNIVFEDIERFFSEERIESDQIEFKSVSDKTEFKDNLPILKKSICGFLNSSGGIIICGAPQGKPVAGKKEKIFKGNLTGFHHSLEKDFIVSSISDGIIPLPASIRVRILEKKGLVILVFEIDSSDYSPHQTNNIYYMRIDGQTKPAPHHYIESLFKKIKYPNIESALKINGFEIYGGNKYRVSFTIFFSNWSPLLNEERLTFRVISNGVFEAAGNPQMFQEYSLNGMEFFKLNAKDVFYYGEPVVESNALIFDPYKLLANENKGFILISFGGKFSPRKCSEYSLNLAQENLNNPAKIITSKKENLLSIEIHNEKGMTKEKLLENMMGLNI